MLLKMVFLASCLFVHELWRVKKEDKRSILEKRWIKERGKMEQWNRKLTKKENWKKFNIMKKSTFHLFIIGEGTLQCDKFITNNRIK